MFFCTMKKNRQHKQIEARDKIELSYTPGKVFCIGFLYFGKDLLIITGLEDDIISYARNHFQDKMYLFILHKYDKYNEKSIDNLNILMMPDNITDQGINISIQRKNKGIDILEKSIRHYGKFNPKHYYRFIGFTKNTKKLIGSYKRIPRCIPEIILTWLKDNGISDELISRSISYPSCNSLQNNSNMIQAEANDILNEKLELEELDYENVLEEFSDL